MPTVLVAPTSADPTHGRFTFYSRGLLCMHSLAPDGQIPETLPLKTSPNTIDALESEYLYTGRSQIAGSGTGLFTAIAIYKDETIAVFTGEILSDLEAKDRAGQGNDRYFISLEDGRTMDSMHVKCFAKYANDAQGSTASIFKNNARIMVDDNNEVCIQATRNISAEEELFCAYGKKYWHKHG